MDGNGIPPWIEAEHHRRAATRAQQAKQHADGRGLARAVGAKETVHFSLLHREVEAVKGADASEGFDDPVGVDGDGHGVTVRLFHNFVNVEE